MIDQRFMNDLAADDMIQVAPPTQDTLLASGPITSDMPQTGVRVGRAGITPEQSAKAGGLERPAIALLDTLAGALRGFTAQVGGLPGDVRSLVDMINKEGAQKYLGNPTFATTDEILKDTSVRVPGTNIDLPFPQVVPSGVANEADRQKTVEFAQQAGTFLPGPGIPEATVKGGKLLLKGIEATKDLPIGMSIKDVSATPRTDVVSTRLPTAVKATEDPLASNLIIDFEAIKKDPEAFKHNMALVQQYPNFASKARNPEKRAEDFISEVKDNLLYLYDKVPDQTRQRSKLWYDGARNIVDDWTGKYGANDSAIAGVLAVLSPQKDWFMNVSLGERVLDTMTNKQSFKWDSSMDDMAKIIWSKPQYAPMVDAIRGKALSELGDPGLKAMWLRTYDQAYNPREHQIVNPEGTFAGVRLTEKGVPYKTGWGSLNEIGKAINIYENPTLANISDSLGTMHKVRNFYNNIYDPTNPSGYVTIDTHAVAAGLLRPLSGASTEVVHNFASNVKGSVGPANSSITGVQGTYGLYAEAYRRAAQERGVLPREMQSITWEAVRGLFPDTFKNAKNSELIDNIWLKYRKGQISQTEARDEVFKSANGINPPEWERSGLRSQPTQEVQATPYQGQLPGVSVPGGNPGDMGSGKRGRVAKGNTTSVTGQPSGMAIGEQ
jgi:hypothetical protein